MTDALVATLERRRTAVAEGLPLGLTDDFAMDRGKQRQWAAFLGKNRLAAPDLETVVSELRAFVQVPLTEAVLRLDKSR